MSSGSIVVTLVVLATAVAVVVVAAAPARRMSERLGQLFEGHIAPKFFPARHLDLLALQRRIVVAALTGVTVSVSGERYLTRHLRMQVSQRDHWRLANDVDGGLQRVGTDLATEIGRRAAKLGYTVPSDMRVEVLVSTFVVDGRPVRAGSGTGAQPEAAATPSPSGAVASGVEIPTPAASAPLHGTKLAATRRWQADKDATVNMETASLTPDRGGSPIRLTGRRTTIGRKAAGDRCDLMIDHPTVSSTHAEVRCSRGVWSLVDGRSTNGTFVNGEQIKDKKLADGDRVQFSSDGPTFVFRLSNASGVPAASEMCGGPRADRRSV